MTEKTYKPLNVMLFRRMEATFKSVRVKNQGQSAVMGKVYDSRVGKVVEAQEQSGEQYSVCCPLCNDTRFRLFISHKYGTDTPDGSNNKHLAYCFNMGCPLNYKQPEAYDKLYHMLTGRTLFDLSKSGISQGTYIAPAVTTGWPGEVVPVNKLDPSHKCRVYLESDRSFNVNSLVKYYNVHYCVKSDHKVCEDKIIIPIYSEGKMIGWQARCCFDVDDWSKVYTPKYYLTPHMKKGNVWYNLDVARKCRVGVAVEGVTDVWRIGSPGICSFGAVPSDRQVELIVKHFRNKPFIWLSDGDVWDENSKVDPNMRKKLTTMFTILGAKLKSGFCCVKLPADMDPAKFTSRAYLRNYISHHAAKSGVKVDWSV